MGSPAQIRILTTAPGTSEGIALCKDSKSLIHGRSIGGDWTGDVVGGGTFGIGVVDGEADGEVLGGTLGVSDGAALAGFEVEGFVDGTREGVWLGSIEIDGTEEGDLLGTMEMEGPTDGN